MLSKFILPTLLLSTAPFAHASDRDKNYPLGGAGLQISVLSATKFCFFLPPEQGQTVGESEGNPWDAANNATAKSRFAVSYCTELGMPGTDGARLMPSGCIKSAHFTQGVDQVQVTGTIDPEKCNNVVKDGGGFYDLSLYVNSPPGGMCYNYGGFINILNTADAIYCIRCCKDPNNNCGVDQGNSGCGAAMFAGMDTSDGFTNNGTATTGPATTASSGSASPTETLDKHATGNNPTSGASLIAGSLGVGAVLFAVASLFAL
ncbi:hypothetical protein HDV00_012137 [Rhizophlyctis rosea]|nr:hypothetical protein HDV00_012137 [Rhizophlyctis rosea]